MKKSIISFALLFAMITVSAQDKDKVIADETTLSDLKSTIKVETSNDLVFERAMSKLKSKMTRYMVTFKKDRKGPYAEYVMYFKQELKDEIIEAFKKL